MLLVLILKNNLPFTVNNLCYYLLQYSKKLELQWFMLQTAIIFQNSTKQRPLRA